MKNPAENIEYEHFQVEDVMRLEKQGCEKGLWHFTCSFLVGIGLLGIPSWPLGLMRLFLC